MANLYDDVEKDVSLHQPRISNSIYAGGLNKNKLTSSYNPNPWGKTSPAQPAPMHKNAYLHQDFTANGNSVAPRGVPQPLFKQETRTDPDLFDDVLVSRERETKQRNEASQSSSLDSKASAIKLNPESQKKLSCYVGNLTWWTTDEDLTTTLISIGVSHQEILNIQIQEHERNGQSKGYCLVNLATELAQQRVLKNLTKMQINGKMPEVRGFEDASKNYFESKCKVGHVAKKEEPRQATPAQPALPNGLATGLPEPMSLPGLPNPAQLANLPNPLNMPGLPMIPGLPPPNPMGLPGLSGLPQLPNPNMLMTQNSQKLPDNTGPISQKEFDSMMEVNRNLCNNGISQAYRIVGNE